MAVEGPRSPLQTDGAEPTVHRRRTYTRPVNFKDVTGQRFGRLVAVEPARKKGYGRKAKIGLPAWNCRCDCGTMHVVATNNLLAGRVLSCGCAHYEFHDQIRRTHGATIKGANLRTYTRWRSAKERCYNTANKAFHNYGGRGIVIHPSWLNDYAQFLADMGECPDGLTLERIDNSRGYEPGNCRWATRKEQMRNVRYNRMITFRGETKCVAEWSELLGVGRQAIEHRHSLGLPIDTPRLRPWTRRRSA